jgi:hypothetical protein
LVSNCENGTVEFPSRLTRSFTAECEENAETLKTQALVLNSALSVLINL